MNRNTIEEMKSSSINLRKQAARKELLAENEVFAYELLLLSQIGAASSFGTV